MSGRRKVTPEMEERFKKYHEQGLRYAKIARLEGVSPQTVSNYINHGGTTDYLLKLANREGHDSIVAHRKAVETRKREEGDLEDKVND